MKIVIAGGSGYLGKIIARYYNASTNEIIILSRKPNPSVGNTKTVCWDGKTLGAWVPELENADVLINLAGKNVNCRYTAKNKKEILSSRVNATKVLGEAVRLVKHPPALWIQGSSATIYRESRDLMMNENGQRGIGFSEMVCRHWEKAFEQVALPHTRKITLRIGIVLGASDSALPRLINLVKIGFGGRQGDGQQFMSWVHENDVANVIEWLRTHPLQNGIYNCTSPRLVKNATFMSTLQHVLAMPFGIPIPRWLLAIGAFVIGTETELVLKSRKVYPQRLLDNGFVFEFPDLKSALVDLCQRETTDPNNILLR